MAKERHCDEVCTIYLNKQVILVYLLCAVKTLL